MARADSGNTDASGESIYVLVPKPVVVKPKPGMYHSKHKGVVDPGSFEMGVKQRKKYATMGTAMGVISIDPSRFTRSHTGKPCVSEAAPAKRAKLIRKGPVPPRVERPVMGLRSDMDFIRENALGNIRAAPPSPPQQEPRFVFKPDFGRIPKYLQRTKAQIRRERAELDERLQAREASQRGEELPQEERAELLALLKAKWGEVNAAFLRLPLQLDTPAKRARKEALERRLAQLEADIRLLAQRGRLVVVDG